MTKKASEKNIVYSLYCLYDKYMSIMPSVFNFHLFIFFFSNSIFFVKSFQNLTHFLKSMKKTFNIRKPHKVHLTASLLNLSFHDSTAAYTTNSVL